MTRPTTQAPIRPDTAARPDTLTRLDTVTRPDTPTRPDATGRVDCVIVRPQPAASTGHPRDLVVAAAVQGVRTVFDRLRGRLVTGGVVWLDVAEPAHSTGADVTGLAWRMALAVQRDGWILRNAITCTPGSASADAVGVSTLFLLTRQRRYYFTLPTRADAVPAVAGARAVAAWPAPACRTDGRRRPGAAAPRQRRTTRRRQRHTTGCPEKTRAGAGAVEMNPGDVWRLPADLPDHLDPDLESPPRCQCAPTNSGDLVGARGDYLRSVTVAARAILLGCPPGGLVHDPLAGCEHGPVARAAGHLGRRFQPADRPAEALPTHVGAGLGRLELAAGTGR
jgi:hypothetical protein